MSIINSGSITQQKNPAHGENTRPADPRVAFFDGRASAWDDPPGEVARTLQRLADLRERIGLVSGGSVLEIGCGTGRITGWIAEQARPGRVVAVDFSPAMLAQARRRGVSAEFKLVDICGDLCPPDRQAPAMAPFDTAFCFHSFPHFRDPRRALRNIRSLLKTGGQLMILHLAGSAEVNRFHSSLARPVCHDRLPPPPAWPGMLAKASLNLVSVLDEPELFLLKAAAA